MMTKPLFRIVALAFLVVLPLLWAPPAAAQQDNTVDGIKKRGKLVVGFGSFIPWAMRDKQGQWIGFEIDVSAKLAKDMGVEVSLVPAAFDAIVPSLIAGKFDVIIGGLSVTPERKEQIDFSDPYSSSGQNVAASRAAAAKLKWPDDYNSPAVTWVCRRATPSCKIIEERWPKATIRQFDDDAIAFQEVINGSAHAIVSSEPKPTYFTLKNPERLFKPSAENITQSVQSFGVRKGSANAMAYYNDWIGKNKEWLGQRHTYWFKTQDWTSRVP